MTRIKICGLTREEDAQLAIELGADALGFVLEPTSPRQFLIEENPWIWQLPTFTPRVAVFGQIPRGANFQPYHLIQSAVFPDDKTFRAKTIQAIRLREGDTLESFFELPELGEAILLDAHSDTAYGGTGKRVDWGLARQIVNASTRRVILAGGLTPDNVAEAIQVVRPYAVDVSSGVEESHGVKDHVKLRDFIQAVRSV